MKQIVISFPSIDKSMIGLRFSGGPFFFPGFGSGVKMPIVSSSGAGGFPYFAVVFRIIKKYVPCFREQMVAHILYVQHVCIQSHYFYRFRAFGRLVYFTSSDGRYHGT